MTAMKNGGVRCDVCGRLSRDPLGYYQNRDGSSGCIREAAQQGRPDLPANADVCDHCAPPPPQGESK